MITPDSEFPAAVPWFFGEQKRRLIPFARKPGLDRAKITPPPKRILIIDDEETIADSLAEILNDAGYDAHAFYSGNEAVEFARRHAPDLVLSDVIMPKMNGIDTVLAIKRCCPHARVVLFSGQASTKDLLDTARAEGHRFEMLPKPIHPEQLLKALSRKDNV